MSTIVGAMLIGLFVIMATGTSASAAAAEPSMKWNDLTLTKMGCVQHRPAAVTNSGLAFNVYGPNSSTKFYMTTYDSTSTASNFIGFCADETLWGVYYIKRAGDPYGAVVDTLFVRRGTRAGMAVVNVNATTAKLTAISTRLTICGLPSVYSGFSAKVAIQRRAANSTKWTTIATVTTGSTGKAAPVTVARKYYYRTVVVQTTTHATSTSAQRLL